VTTTELEAEILDALRFGASPVDGIAERARCDAEEALDVLLDLERRRLVRRHPDPGRLPATRTWWELTGEGHRLAG
jgi:hypothetical protein